MSTPSTTLARLDKVKAEMQKTNLSELVNHDYIKHQLGLHYGNDASKKIEQFKANYLVLMSDPTVAKNLESADKFSILNSLLCLTKDGLSINPMDKEAAIVNYGGKAVAVPMVKGKIKKMQQNGVIDRIQYLEVVYEGDNVSNKNGVWNHEININLTGKEKKLGVLLMVLMPDRTVKSKFVRPFEIAKRKEKSKMAAMWTQWEEEMWKKTAINMFEKEIGSKPLFQFVEQEESEETQDAGFSNVETEEEAQEAQGVEEIKQDAILRQNLDDLIADGLLAENEKAKLESLIDGLSDEGLSKWITALNARKEIRDAKPKEDEPPI